MASRTKPLPVDERHLVGRVINRGEQTSRSNDTANNVSIGLMDIDSAVMYYFSEVIKPSVIDNGEMINVPILYSNPERWKAAQRDGYLRDNKRQIILPAITFRRTSTEKDDSITMNAMDANDPKLHYVFERKYSPKNRYKQLDILQGEVASKEYYQVAMPKYVTVNYDCIMWATYIEQMNKLTEKINHSYGSYWGEPGKFKFRSELSGFDDSTETGDGERINKTTFSLTLHGYLLPESFNEQMTTKKVFTPTKTVMSFGEKTLIK